MTATTLHACPAGCGEDGTGAGFTFTAPVTGTWTFDGRDWQPPQTHHVGDPDPGTPATCNTCGHTSTYGDFLTETPETPETPIEVTWAEDYGDGLQFILRDGSFGNPGCDDCGSDDAVVRVDGVYLCSTAAVERALVPPGGWQRITVTETVRAWGYETSTYQTILTIDQIKARVAADTGEDATDSAVAEWLSENLIAVESDLDLQEILDRDSLEVTGGTRKPPTGAGVRV